LLEVFPDVAELLAVVALRKTILGFIGLYPDCNEEKAWQSEHSLGFCRSGQGYENKGRFLVVASSEGDGLFSSV
jgi:hypothetical protein